MVKDLDGIFKIGGGSTYLIYWFAIIHRIDQPMYVKNLKLKTGMVIRSFLVTGM